MLNMCPTCGAQVLPTAQGMCPNCGQAIGETLEPLAAQPQNQSSGLEAPCQGVMREAVVAHMQIPGTREPASPWARTRTVVRAIAVYLLLIGGLISFVGLAAIATGRAVGIVVFPAGATVCWVGSRLYRLLPAARREAILVCLLLFLPLALVRPLPGCLLFFFAMYLGPKRREYEYLVEEARPTARHRVTG